jgi:hypothetical protein
VGVARLDVKRLTKKILARCEKLNSQIAPAEIFTVKTPEWSTPMKCLIPLYPGLTKTKMLAKWGYVI